MKLVQILSIFFFVLSACTRSTDSNSSKKVFYHSEDGSPTNLDPVQGATIYANMVITSLYHTLYEYKYLKRPYELKPNLAVGMPEVSADGLTYKIKIKSGVFFADDQSFADGKGREVEASDFVYSLKRHFDLKNNSQGSWLWQGKIKGLEVWKEQGSDYAKEVEGLKALDKNTIQIVLVKPYPQLIYTFAMGYSAIVPKEAVEKYGKEFSVNPVGSGVWKMVSKFDPNKIILERNEKLPKEKFDAAFEGYDERIHGYTGIKELDGKEMPFVDRVEITFFKERIPRWNSFTKGSEIQYATLPQELVDQVLESKNPVKLKPEYIGKYQLKADPEFGFVYTNFNMANPEIGYNKDKDRELKNKALRCAIRKTFSWPERIERFYYGLGEAFPGVIPPSADGYDPNLSKDSITRDVEGAKKLLADNGWNEKNLPVFEVHSVSDLRSKQFFEQERAWLMDIGYPSNKVKYITYANFGDFNKAVTEKKAMSYGMGWGLDYPDAENTLQLYYGPNESPGSNGANYKNPEYDKLYEKSSVMLPSPERTQIYSQMNKILQEDCVNIASFSRTFIFMWHKNVVVYPSRDVLNNYYKYVDVK